MIVIYLSIAFEWKMAIAAFVALLHDLVIATGVYALAGFQVSPATVIGLLTILGYSLYDTVVVFDKVRENTAGLLGGARTTYSQAANLALNQTLVRSINTSLIALLPVAAILVVATACSAPTTSWRNSRWCCSSACCPAPTPRSSSPPRCCADLKEREPQYKALAKRVAVRASGGRAAKRAVAKAQSGDPRPSRRGSRRALAAQLAEAEPDDADFTDEAAPPADELTADELTATASRAAGQPRHAGRRPSRVRGSSRAGAAAARRGTARAGKKKRR